MLNLVQSPGSGFSVGSSISWLGDKVTTWVNQQVDRKMVDAGNAFVVRAQSLAPVKTGTLRASIDYQVIGRTLTIIIGAPWGIFQEFGTRTIPPHPFIRPALNEINRIFGTDVEILFNRPGGSQWGGIFAHQGGFILPHNLTAKERAHVAKHLLPVSKKFHRGNVKRAKFRVRPFS